MKLTNQQIDALLNNVEKQKKLEYQKEYDLKVKENNIKNKKEITSLLKTYEKIPKILKDLMYYNKNLSEKTITDSLNKIEKKSFDKSDLKNQIIIASIDSKDMEELQKKLSIKF